MRNNLTSKIRYILAKSSGVLPELLPTPGIATSESIKRHFEILQASQRYSAFGLPTSTTSKNSYGTYCSKCISESYIPEARGRSASLERLPLPWATQTPQRVNYAPLAGGNLQLPRCMSTGGLSRRDFLWGISGTAQDQQASPTKGSSAPQKEVDVEIDFFAQLHKEGYNNIQEALQRAVVGAYQLLQDDKVEQAETILTEAVKAAKTVLERNDHMLAQLQDQLALLQFLQGDFKQAEKTALLSLASAQQLETGEGRSLSVAMCQLRLGAILQGLTHHQDAEKLLSDSLVTLQSIPNAAAPPMSEAFFYLAMSRLAQPSSSDLTALEPELLEALESIASLDILGLHLLRACFREHRVLMGAAVDAEDWKLAEAILQQEVRLQEVVLPNSEELALSLYQYATLQYTRGLVKQGKALCQSSLDLSRLLHKKESNSQVALRVHRLGTLALAEGDLLQAIDLLTKSGKSLSAITGDFNPLVGESRAALALAKVGYMDSSLPTANTYVRIEYPYKRKGLMAEAEEGIADMQKGFGAKHLLVLTIQGLLDRLKQSPLTSNSSRL